jgi:hypothetical protein
MALAVLGLAACGAPAREATAGAPEPVAATALRSAPGAPDAAPGTSAPTSTAVPEGQPAVLVGVVTEPTSTALASFDRRTGALTTIATTADLGAQVPGAAPGSPWSVGPLDLSPDGERVAVGLSVGAPDAALDALLVVELDGDPAPRVLASWAPPPEGDSSLAGLAFSPDGAWLATGGPTVTFWPVAGGRPTRTATNMRYPGEMAWSPDGRQLAWGLHWERTDRPQSAVAAGAPRTLTVTDTVDGGGPWWSADGQVHTSHTNRAAPDMVGRQAEPEAIDTDAGHQWVLGHRAGSVGTYWWPAAGPASAAQPLDGLPARFEPAAW